MARTIKNGTGRTTALYIGLAMAILTAFASTIYYVTKVEAAATVNTRDIEHIQRNGHETRELLHRIDKRQVGIEVKQELIMDKLGVRTPD